MKFKGWAKGIKKLLKPRPPIWETREWESMSWDEKMAIWRRHKKINAILAGIFVFCFIASFMWALKTAIDIRIVIAFNVIMFSCLYAARYLME